MCLQKEIARRVRGLLRMRLPAETRGQEAVEFAFVLWILMALIILVFWCGRALSTYQALERAARDGARAYLASTCAQCGDSANDPTTAVDNALTAASLDYTRAQTPPYCAQNQELVDANGPSYDQVSSVTCTVTFPFQISLPLLSFLSNTSGTTPTFNMSATVTMRQEY